MVGASRVDFARESLTWGFQKRAPPMGSIHVIRPDWMLHIGPSLPTALEIHYTSAHLCHHSPKSIAHRLLSASRPWSRPHICPSQLAFMRLAPWRNVAVHALPLGELAPASTHTVHAPPPGGLALGTTHAAHAPRSAGLPPAPRRGAPMAPPLHYRAMQNLKL